MTLTAADFQFQLTDTITLAGCPIGDDDYFVFYGHGWTDDYVLNTVKTYLSEVGEYSETEVDKTLSYALDTFGIERINAAVYDFDDGEWALGFNATDAGDLPRVDVTVLRLL